MRAKRAQKFHRQAEPRAAEELLGGSPGGYDDAQQVREDQGGAEEVHGLLVYRNCTDVTGQRFNQLKCILTIN